ncbi:fringe-like protein [Actinidia rufa]|uniref:Fringe-like protein n=1 Tax=Actinidia rufa TaxID=165716 RepID=A0A7J0GR34_9ERIC|nr:fringe-like protein [Actinidia rufa]
MMHMIVEAFRAENNSVRWYIMMDDDTIIFVDNLVDALAKYDHRKYFYIGANSECISSNMLNSFQMAFGGAGYALSYPLVEALANNFEICIKRYPTLYGSDHVLQSCVADLGVSITQEKGFHQMDLHHDITGFLSSHPQSPLLSLHHLNAFNPIFPSLDRQESLYHLMTAAKADSSRLLQQTICYHKQENLTLSLSWGYSAHIYKGIHPPSVLQIPLETFLPWTRAARPPYMFNTRIPSKNPCNSPHVFFFDSVEEKNGNYIVTSYNRMSPRRVPACSSRGNGSANYIYKIRVLSPLRRYNDAGNRRECCDIAQEAGMNATEVKLRDCLKDEIFMA